MLRRTNRTLENIPVGPIGFIPVEGCKEMGKKVDDYLVKWRTERESEHKDSLAFAATSVSVPQEAWRAWYSSVPIGIIKGTFLLTASSISS